MGLTKHTFLCFYEDWYAWQSRSVTNHVKTEWLAVIYNFSQFGGFLGSFTSLTWILTGLHSQLHWAEGCVSQDNWASLQGGPSWALLCGCFRADTGHVVTKFLPPPRLLISYRPKQATWPSPEATWEQFHLFLLVGEVTEFACPLPVHHSSSGRCLGKDMFVFLYLVSSCSAIPPPLSRCLEMFWYVSIIPFLSVSTLLICMITVLWLFSSFRF